MRKIEYSGNKGRGQFFTVSDESFEKVKGYKWYLSKGYAIANPKITLHRFLTNCPKGMEVDHIDNDKSNYQLNNLRICTHQQNVWNTSLRKDNSSGLRGASYHKRLKKWQSQIMLNGKVKSLGYFGSKQEAAEVHDLKAKELHKEFAKVNKLIERNIC